MEPHPIIDKYAHAIIFKRDVDKLLIDLLVDLIPDKTWTPETISAYFKQYRINHQPKKLEYIKTLLSSRLQYKKLKKYLVHIHETLRRIPGYHYTSLILQLQAHIDGTKIANITDLLLYIEEALIIMEQHREVELEPLFRTPTTKEELLEVLKELKIAKCMIASPTSVLIQTSEAYLYKDVLAKRGINVTEMQITHGVF
jgi:hypothetical protein